MTIGVECGDFLVFGCGVAGYFEARWLPDSVRAMMFGVFLPQSDEHKPANKLHFQHTKNIIRNIISVMDIEMMALIGILNKNDKKLISESYFNCSVLKFRCAAMTRSFDF